MFCYHVILLLTHRSQRAMMTDFVASRCSSLWKASPYVLAPTRARALFLSARASTGRLVGVRIPLWFSLGI